MKPFKPGRAPRGTMVAYWLMKSEPHVYPWEQLVEDEQTHWDGVRNYQARNYLKKMKKNDLCFFYHSVNEKQIVGIVSVVKEHYLDPTDKTKKFVVVDVKAKKSLLKPVTLLQIKKEKSLFIEFRRKILY